MNCNCQCVAVPSCPSLQFCRTMVVLQCVWQVNSVKDLYLLIEEEELSPRLVDNRMVTAEEQSQKTLEEALTLPAEKPFLASRPKQVRQQQSVSDGAKQ